MVAPYKFIKEKERIKLLKSYSILDSLPESDYDNLTTLASQICETPIALITFIDDDRQWFKSRKGLDISETPRDISFCAHAINNPNEVFEINDARKDSRFYDNPTVDGSNNVVFYAGAPIKNLHGLPLGTICVIDHKPKILTEEQKTALQALADQTMKLLELRLNKIELEKTMVALKKKNDDLERFAYIAAHDLKSPLANISGLSDFFTDNYGNSIDKEGNEVINLIKSSTVKLKEMIDNLLLYSKSSLLDKENCSDVLISDLEKDFSNLYIFKDNCIITFKATVNSICVNKGAFEQILNNLVTNAIKYSDKEKIQIDIVITEERDFYMVTVTDNGIGISIENQKNIFDLFTIVNSVDRFGAKGTGIGLATVKKLVEDLGGTISVYSKVGKGSKFIFTLARN
ncbi:histidine kinase [Flavobacterium fryxellicola]|uniref:histidine kinase n=2 Tax=Flavobacterium fryxellicola TaxID=249352 RepID=A0A167WWJ6_9FLAO|nr:histidine kinase [Flavobacterium fryxellicola]